MQSAEVPIRYLKPIQGSHVFFAICKKGGGNFTTSL